MAIVDGCVDDPGSRTQFTVESNKGTDEKVYLGTGLQVKMRQSLLKVLWPDQGAGRPTSPEPLAVMSYFSFSQLLTVLPSRGRVMTVLNWR